MNPIKKTWPVKTDCLYYLCTVYTSNPNGLDGAYQEACAVTAKLTELGALVYCPIAHGHGMSEYLTVSKTDYDFWMGLDKRYINYCDRLLVATMPNWETSRGITEEIRYATEIGKPVEYLELKRFRTIKRKDIEGHGSTD